MRFPSKRWQRAILIIVVTFAVLELGLKAIGRYVLEKQYSHTSAPPYKEGDINILCLGESTTVGLWVKPEESYPKQLEALLRKELGTDAIRAIVPPHIGQNTSQQANRIEDYLDRYRPKVVILMAGANNEWALNESHIARFLKLGSLDTLYLHVRIFADRSSVFKALRHLFLRVSDTNAGAIWGHPEKTEWPPRAEVTSFARENAPAFLELWRSDMTAMIDAAKARSLPVIVMTYPIMPRYLAAEEFRKLAEGTGSTFVDNSATFEKLKEEGSIPAYLERDNWHPSGPGYALIAESLKAVIVERRLLGL
jgi:lysophospholipase L1-like esterase